MARIIPLFSGSKGNCWYIGASGKGIIIDVGRSSKQTENALEHFGIDIKSIHSIFVTHEHSDHVNGLRVFASKHNKTAYASEGTISELVYSGVAKGIQINALFYDEKGGYTCVTAGDFLVQPFSTSHDASESVGYRVTLPDGKTVCLATDLGYISDDVKKHLLGSDAVIIESNHDVGMLKNGAYPYVLKRRILSDIGHLSNDSCAEILPQLVKSGTTRIILAHLSRENNYPDLAYHTSLLKLNEASMKADVDFNLKVAREVYDDTVIYL